MRRGSLRLRPAPSALVYCRLLFLPGVEGSNGSTRDQNSSETTHEAKRAFPIGQCLPWKHDGKTVYHYLRISTYFFFAAQGLAAQGFMLSLLAPGLLAPDFLAPD